MDHLSSSGSGLTPLPIPTDGLFEVLRRWSGRGRLYDALAAVDDGQPWDWRRRDIERRGSRILFQKLVPRLLGWPTRLDDWINALPAQSIQERFLSDSPRRGVSWRESRRYGWPPLHYVGRNRTRVALRELVGTLRWTLDNLLILWGQAVKGGTEVDADVRPQMVAAKAILKLPAMHLIEPAAPTPETLRSMRSEGDPWGRVADVAEALLALDATTLYDLAQEIVEPDPDLRWRLFHLAVLGSLIRTLILRNAEVTSRRPLADGSGGLAYEIQFDGVTWDLWFEGAGLWRTYKVPSPYQHAMGGLGGSFRPRSPDIVLVDRENRALVLECKYSSDIEYISEAYAQVTAYANELRSGVVDRVVALTVAPEGVASFSSVQTALGPIGILSPSQLDMAVSLVVES